MWQFDIKYIYIEGENRFAYYLGFIDVFDREIVNYYLGYKCTAKNLKVTLEEALKFRGIKEREDLLIVRSDRGTQMTSIEFSRYIGEDEKLIHELIPPHTPDKNAYIESFNSILEIEGLQRVSFRNFEDAYSMILRFIDHYNNRRLHGSTRYLPPSEFREKYARGDLGTIEVHVSG
jgi:putative transposase